MRKSPTIPFEYSSNVMISKYGKRMPFKATEPQSSNIKIFNFPRIKTTVSIVLKIHLNFIQFDSKFKEPCDKTL